MNVFLDMDTKNDNKNENTGSQIKNLIINLLRFQMVKEKLCLSL